MIRVGTCTYEGSKRIDPTFPGFTPTVVLMSSHSKWGDLGPYNLKDDKNRIQENVWQFSKIYLETTKTTQRYSRWDQTIIWSQNKETHARECENTQSENAFIKDGKNFEVTQHYKTWRKKGKNNPYAVRYPNGFHGKKKVFTALIKNIETGLWESIDYITARKMIYCPLYCHLAEKLDVFWVLKNRLLSGENLLIIEVDGPKDPDFWAEKYDKPDLFQNSTMLINKENIQTVLNEEKYSFGHGYCLACALLGKEEWLLATGPLTTSYQQDFLRFKHKYDGPYILDAKGNVVVEFC